MKYIFSIFALIVLTSCNQDNKRSKDLTVKSKKLLERNNLDSARILIAEALKLDPKNYVAYNNRAYLKFKENRPSREIIADYKKSLEIKPDYEVAIYSLANYHFEIKDYKNAIILLNQVLELPDKGELSAKDVEHAYAIRGESFKWLLNFDNAIKDLLKAIQLNPESEGSHKELADCYFLTGENAPAIEEYTKAIEIDSNYYQAYLGRAQCFEKNTPPRMDLAAKDYNTALRINPHIEDIYNTDSPLFLRAKKLALQNNSNNN